ncbi:MAG TPA: hypothetical protein PKO47_03325 [bacterium]|nr:hypothetical protein [bacterium]HNO09885.1 hypothetical protein [bacterium]
MRIITASIQQSDYYFSRKNGTIGMFHEIKNVSQSRGEPFRRWFEDNYFDLVVWYNKNGSFYGFQLSYDRYRHEHAITWFSDRGYFHDKVQNTDGSVVTMTPVLVANGPFDGQQIAERFRQHSAGLEIEIAEFIYDKVTHYEQLKPSDTKNKKAGRTPL